MGHKKERGQQGLAGRRLAHTGILLSGLQDAIWKMSVARTPPWNSIAYHFKCKEREEEWCHTWSCQKVLCFWKPKYLVIIKKQGLTTVSLRGVRLVSDSWRAQTGLYRRISFSSLFKERSVCSHPWRWLVVRPQDHRVVHGQSKRRQTRHGF